MLWEVSPILRMPFKGLKSKFCETVKQLLFSTRDGYRPFFPEIRCRTSIGKEAYLRSRWSLQANWRQGGDASKRMKATDCKASANRNPRSGAARGSRRGFSQGAQGVLCRWRGWRGGEPYHVDSLFVSSLKIGISRGNSQALAPCFHRRLFTGSSLDESLQYLDAESIDRLCRSPPPERRRGLRILRFTAST